MGGIRLLRNDGGNNHHFIKMKLVGLRAGSAKNNYYGIGAKVEVRSGSLYQSMVVTEPNIHFGLGSREKAEVIRILWTNGVPQNMFFPATNQDLIEEQQLKGSCPFLYTWNGEEYSFVKDIMWKSALGMPLGIMGESSTYAPSDASVDYIKNPGRLMLKDEESNTPCRSLESCGKPSTWISLSWWCSIIQHQWKLYVDERMGPPSTSGYTLYQVEEKRPPVAATINMEPICYPRSAIRMTSYTSGFSQGKYQGVTRMSRRSFLIPGEIDPSRGIFSSICMAGSSPPMPASMPPFPNRMI